VAVDPDETLRAYAAVKKWPLLTLSTPLELQAR
jgi:hypothetical protein